MKGREEEAEHVIEATSLRPIAQVLNNNEFFNSEGREQLLYILLLCVVQLNYFTMEGTDTMYGKYDAQRGTHTSTLSTMSGTKHTSILEVLTIHRFLEEQSKEIHYYFYNSRYGIEARRKLEAGHRGGA